MKVISKFLIFTIAIIGFSFVDASAKSISDHQNDSIERQVEKEIKKLPYYGVFDVIGYEVDGNTVILSGKVLNAVNRKSAERRIEKIDGVEIVINNIKVLPLSRFDNSIRYRTVNALLRGGSLYRYLQGVNPSMRIIVDRGHITLEGFVRTKGDASLANILARSVRGTFSVTNNLIVTKDLKS